MADKTIGDLNPVPGSIDNSNTLFVVQQSGTAYKVTGANFISALATILDGHGGIKSIEYTPPAAPSLTGTMTITLADDTTTSVSVQNGKGITSITDYWRASSSDGSVPSSWSTTRETMTSTNRYLWHYQVIAYNDGTSVSTTKTVVGVYGDTGQAWYVWIRYSGTQPTQDADIGTVPDKWIGIYSGTSATAPTHYTDYSWYEIKGAKGDTGDSITSISRTSGSGAPGTTDTYTAYVNSTAIGTFTVYNGEDGEGSPGANTPLVDSGAGVVGVQTAYSRQDHQHPLNVATSGTPSMDGTAALGSAATYARTDHVHPHDTSRAMSGEVASSDIDAITQNGIYRVSGNAALLIHLNWDNQYAYQIYNQYNEPNGTLKYRKKDGGTWSAWTVIVGDKTNYSPEVMIDAGTTRAITGADLGATFFVKYDSSHASKDTTFTLSQANSDPMPNGAEFAFATFYGRDTYLQVSGVRVITEADGLISAVSANKTFLLNKNTIIGLKKVEDDPAQYGDIWMLMGNVEEVVS